MISEEIKKEESKKSESSKSQIRQEDIKIENIGNDGSRDFSDIYMQEGRHSGQESLLMFNQGAKPN